MESTLGNSFWETRFWVTNFRERILGNAFWVTYIREHILGAYFTERILGKHFRDVFWGRHFMERILGKQFWEHILGNVFLQKNFNERILRKYLRERILETTYEGLPGGGGGSLFPCSLPKLPYVPMFPHSLRMFSYCNFSKFCFLFPKMG